MNHPKQGTPEYDQWVSDVLELERLVNMRDELPHLYGFPWYKWAKEFFDNTDRAAFLTAANQVSKSATMARKCINLATEPSLWKKIWPGLLKNQKPNSFWYFYPTQETWQHEYETKWKPDYLPRGQFIDHPQYGWTPRFDKGMIKKIEFNSGIVLSCKSYSQKKSDLQTGTVWSLFLDEECPTDLLPELQARIRAAGSTGGILNSVFTATKGQEYWRRVMEPNNKEEEIYPNAHKRTVSLYDCQTYIDGTKSKWSDERINEVIAECGTDAEVQRRVFGRFVKSENLKYESFDIQRNMMTPQAIDPMWGIFAGVDPGSGGKSGHPAAIIFVAVNPLYTEGWVFKGWRGDNISTANPDILKKFRELKGDMMTMSQVYDYKDKDFYLVSISEGESFIPANKARDEGAGVLNSLFKNGMLKIFRNDPELDKLVGELLTLDNNPDKRKAKDDLIDSLRYCCMSIPFSFAHIKSQPLSTNGVDGPDERSDEQRSNDELLSLRKDFLHKKHNIDDSYESEIEFFNELSGSND